MVLLDPFFSLRGSEHWSQEAGVLNTRNRRLRFFSFALACVLGALLGFGVRNTRNALADEALFERESPLEYLAKTRVHSREASARAEIQRLETVRASDAHQAERTAEFERGRQREQLRTTASRALAPWVQEEERRLIAEGNAKYTPIATRNPQMRTLIERVLLRGSETGSRVFQLRPVFLPNLAIKSVHDCRSVEQVTAMWTQVVNSLNAVFLQVYSPEVFRLDGSLVSPLDTASDLNALIETQDDGKLDSTTAFDTVRASFQIDVVSPLIVLTSRKDSVLMKLVVPPKKAPILRSSSLFSQMDPKCREGYFPALARAFDRFYDELYGLFFSGPIRIPLRLVAPATSK
jgi:hypothetical protein